MQAPEPPAAERAARRVIPIQADAAPAGTSLYAAEKKIYPRAVSGRFANWRWALVALTQAFFYGMPWLQWEGRQALLFDLVGGRFYIGALVFYPQDLIYLATLLVFSALLLFFFTALAGRLWCGYACPQTVYTELFLWIERHTEGDRQARMRLDAAPWSVEKLWRKTAKHGGWIALALFTGFSFVGYFSPIRALTEALFAWNLSPWEAFWVLFYAGATYGNAGWLREQMCKYICPYARFQSALIDADSLIITYDARRGEPRGARSRKSAEVLAEGRGDCVDCTLCVQVCPTGIDIRKGLQNECIGCAACIDVCDQVMDKIGAPHGLIRYATENGVAQGLSRAQMWRRTLRPRVLIYGGALAVLGALMLWQLSQRSALLIDVIKDRGVMARQVEDGQIENVYRLQLLNRSERTLHLQFEAEGLPGLRVLGAERVTVDPAAIVSLPVQLRLPAGAVQDSGARRVHLLARDLDHPETPVFQAEASFFVPR
ncbi:cytochrome c oxidase accessory protein CcoG [Pelomonas sp. APW6]|uniref:Cytochrome c oxidase accessory protein CcoG n=1 Tax=Roseateles subflavus TaxID=3053353 RepID=A0ABT7LMI2_9BURK|nr:cytochrome c oxidase accessory protein CcoG [Pelomonas sp. APW6]MDL5034070.1 cytochrome c oxidase accessory protein CcoG [Pelomonas sp. APW6]